MKKIVVTSANSNIAKVLIPQLLQRGYTVTGLVRAPSPLEVDHLVTQWTTNPEATQCLQEADAIIHLSGEIFGRKWEDFYEPNVRTTEIVANSIKNSLVKKVIYLSYLGADKNSDNLFLRAKGVAESLLTQGNHQTLIFRFQAGVDPQNPSGFEEYLTYKGKEPIRLIGNGKQVLRVIYIPDVVNFILAGLESNHSGIYNIASLDKFTLNEFVQLINHNPKVPIQYTPGWLAKILSAFIKELSSTTIDLYLRKPIDIDFTKAINEFKVIPYPLKKIYQTNAVK